MTGEFDTEHPGQDLQQRVVQSNFFLYGEGLRPNDAAHGSSLPGTTDVGTDNEPSDEIMIFDRSSSETEVTYRSVDEL